MKTNDVAKAIETVTAHTLSDSAFKAIDDARWLLEQGDTAEAMARVRDAWTYDHPMAAFPVKG